MQGYRQRHGTDHRRYRARTTGAAACSTRSDLAAPSTPAELIRKLLADERAAHDAHFAAYQEWRAAPDNPVRRARLTAAYRAWQAAREARRRARPQQPGLSHTSSD